MDIQHAFSPIKQDKTNKRENTCQREIHRWTLLEVIDFERFLGTDVPLPLFSSGRGRHAQHLRWRWSFWAPVVRELTPGGPRASGGKAPARQPELVSRWI